MAAAADQWSMASAAADVISPELVLVCPELRAAALAALPEPDTEARIEPPEYRLMRSLAAAEEAEMEWSAPLPVAVLAYTLKRATKVTAEMAALLGGIAVLLAIVAVLRF
jgi:hypothetical protein